MHRVSLIVPGIGEVIVDLIVKFDPVGDDDKRPVTGNFPQDFLGEEDHRVTLATALRVPEDPEPSLGSSGYL